MNKVLRRIIAPQVIVITLLGSLSYTERATLAEKIMAKGLKSRLKDDFFAEHLSLALAVLCLVLRAASD
jgi:hypothetical protein